MTSNFLGRLGIHSHRQSAGLRLLMRPSSWRLDMGCLIVAMLIVVFAPPIGSHMAPVAQVLALRVSMLNFFLASLCVLSWRLIQICMSLQANYLQLSWATVAYHVALQVTGCTAIAGLALLATHPRAIAKDTMAFWLVASVLLWCVRMFLFALHVTVVPRLRKQRQVLIVGSGWRAQQVAQQLHSHPRWNYHLMGFVDSQPQFPNLDVLGGIENLEDILMRRPIDEVVITLPVKSKYDDIQNAISICERAGIQSGYSVDMFTMEVTKRRCLDEHDSSSVILHMVHNDGRQFLKRALDLVGAAVALLLLSPLLLCVAIAIKLTSPGPAIFCQQRYGLNKRRFTMYKFRSMVVDAEKRQKELEPLNETTGPVFKIRNDPRITPIGRLIRQTSIDELPQLFNVLWGDMSLVGPRPLPMRDVGNFEEAWLMRRFSVRPGLTGLWQVSGRSNSTFANWIKLDLEYIDQWSLLLDVRIIARTFPAVIKRDGAV